LIESARGNAESSTPVENFFGLGINDTTSVFSPASARDEDQIFASAHAKIIFGHALKMPIPYGFLRSRVFRAIARSDRRTSAALVILA
jgi:hypothetical protein